VKNKIKWPVLFILLIVISVLPSWKLTNSLDLFFLDFQYNFLREYIVKKAPLENEVVLIGIDENTYYQFKEPFSLWHDHLGSLFSALAVSNATVFGVDLTFPDRSYNHILPEHDQKLLKGMINLKRKAPFVLGITIEQNGKARKVYAPFLSIAGKDGQGFVLWKQDQDHIVRRYYRNLGRKDTKFPTLVSQMASYLSYNAPSGLINYLQGGAVNYIPLQDVLKWYKEKNFKKLKNTFHDRAVLIGSVLPFEDRHYQPVNLAAWEQENNNYVPGVLIHLQALRNILNNGLIHEVSFLPVLLINLTLLFLWLIGKNFKTTILLGLSLFVLFNSIQGWLLLQNIYFPVAASVLGMFIVLLARSSMEIIFELLEKNRLRKLFSGYVSPHVMNEILKGNIQPGTHGERKKVCVLFSDIRGFTSISEKMQPEEIICFLNIYLAEMTEAIQGNDGTIDKFMGDGIMAFFGAPLPSETAVFDAFNAARDKLTKLQHLADEFKNDPSMPEIKIGIGLHLGYAVIGNIGSEQRNEYTAIGDVVNITSRLEGLTKEVGYPIVVSNSVAEVLKDTINFDHIGEMPVKGRAPVDVFGWPPKNEVTSL